MTTITHTEWINLHGYKIEDIVSFFQWLGTTYKTLIPSARPGDEQIEFDLSDGKQSTTKTLDELFIKFIRTRGEES